MKNDSDDLTLCANFPDAPTASLAVGLLGANDIPAIADNATINTLLPIAGSVRVMVRERDLEQARRVLAQGGMLH